MNISRNLTIAAAFTLSLLTGCAITPQGQNQGQGGPVAGGMPAQQQVIATPGECRVEGMKPVRVASQADCDTIRQAMKVTTPAAEGQILAKQDGRPPTQKDGKTCALIERGTRRVIEDFFDSTRNQERIVVPSVGAADKCFDAIQRARSREPKQSS